MADSPFEPRPLLQQLLASPLTVFLRYVYSFLLRIRGPAYTPPAHARPIRIVCISDTHTLKCDNVPDGDLLIHSGDLSNAGTVKEIQEAVNWLNSLPHPQKVAICGNHDSYFDIRSRQPEDLDDTDTETDYDYDTSKINWGEIIYLQHSSTTLFFPPSSPTTSTPTPTRTLNIYGAPQVPRCGGREHAFQYPPASDAWRSTIPAETDILITHTPPRYHLDLAPFSMGCRHLLREIWRVRPTLHVFGHVHAGHGVESVFWDEAQGEWERLCEMRQGVVGAGEEGEGEGGAGDLGGRRRNFFIADLLGVRAWVGALKVVVYSLRGVVWSRVWGGTVTGGMLVNAACMYRSSGVLGNEPRVVYL
ncbi:hypothetical protein FQN54_002705 [Arachnomyces sp. PD_36]|nr:hypothetical protein FQN54_002705 [Arachnomyces sp. PD_36]